MLCQGVQDLCRQVHQLCMQTPLLACMFRRRQGRCVSVCKRNVMNTKLIKRSYTHPAFHTIRFQKETRM